MFFMIFMIKETLQPLPVTLIKHELVLANPWGKYNRKPAMHTFYYLSML